MHDHRDIDARSLAFGQLIAERIRAEPELVEHARNNLQRWLQTCAQSSTATLKEWISILEGSVDDIAAVLTGTDDRAVRLRQSNPFAGVLTPSERNSILRQFQTHDTPAA
ncbi:MAG TPA: hypothetical protein PKB10_12740 [Tepidisphaeraceae bacterium]|nr:hypothetical protein [Tepidisphaeraceae bacterium]